MKLKLSVLMALTLLSSLAIGQRETRPVDPKPPVVERPPVQAEQVRASVMLHGTRGGGETVNIRGIPVLRDLVEKTNCHWVNGEEMMRVAKSLPAVLDSLKKLDWFFAAELKAELRYLSFCRTEQLLKLEDDDHGPIHPSVEMHASQAAIRINSDVYLDVSIFNRMSEDSKAYLLLHEVLHSYLHSGIERRNQKLRSMTKTLEQVHTGPIQTRRELHLQMTKNEVSFPQTVGRLSNYRSQLEFLLSDNQEKREILSRQSNLEAFYKKISEINGSLLLEVHRPLLVTNEVWSENVRMACEAGDEEAFRLYARLSGDELRSHGICALALDLRDETSTLAKLLIENFRRGNYLRQLSQKLSGKKLYAAGGRLWANPSLGLISAAPSAEVVTLMNITSVACTQDLAPEFAALTKFLDATELTVEEVLDQNFLKVSFDINLELKELEKMMLNYPRERELGLLRLPLIYQHFWDVILDTLPTPERTGLRQKINSLNLGYKI